jgi:hypothetical protein
MKNRASAEKQVHEDHADGNPHGMIISSLKNKNILIFQADAVPQNLCQSWFNLKLILKSLFFEKI